MILFLFEVRKKEEYPSFFSLGRLTPVGSNSAHGWTNSSALPVTVLLYLGEWINAQIPGHEWMDSSVTL